MNRRVLLIPLADDAASRDLIGWQGGDAASGEHGGEGHGPEESGDEHVVSRKQVCYVKLLAYAV